MSDTVRTITITEDKSGVFFATSEDSPPLFCAAASLVKLFESVARVLRAAAVIDGEADSLIPVQRGCICPPKSEETCSGFACPRRVFKLGCAG